jgi:RNA polymerase sigma factor (sigma-70 family)
MHNPEEFIEIIKANQGLINKVAKLYSKSREDEQDLYQEIVCQTWKSFDSFRNESKISTWIYRIALNTSISYMDKTRKKGDHLPIDDILLNRTEPSDTVKEEQIEILYGQIRNLNPIEKGILFLYLEGKTYDEITSITGFSSTNVGTRLGRIRQNLITQIKK